MTDIIDFGTSPPKFGRRVVLVDASGNALVSTSGMFTQGPVANDGVSTANPVITGGVASAAAPTSVSGDLDAVQSWYLRNGAQATVLTAAGALIGGDAANGIDVDVTRIAAGEVHLGFVSSEILYVTSTPTLSVAGAYAAADYIGPTTTPASFLNAVRTSAGKSILKSLVIADKVVTAAVPLELWLFSATFTAPTDNAAWTITDAEALTVVGVVPITTDRWFLGTVNKIYSDDSLSLPISCAATTLFYGLVARGATPTWASGDIQITAGLLPS